ncbi:HET-domain-containing protein [Apiospora kogelbergensis]|uniref:HET-domain-containing protein n=1 Tax=Apiospora kogelbergensis TaxID=1337665 RepID=UPI00312D5D7D
MAPQDLLPGQHQEVGQLEDQIYHDMNKRSMAIRETRLRDIMLHDNSVGATRGWDGPLLFVPTEAHVVRPPDQLGFRARKDDEGRIAVWVDDPEPGTEISHKSLQLRTDHTICTACRDVLDYYCEFVSRHPKDTGKDPPESLDNNNVIHHSSLWSLCAFALGVECHICSQIWEKVDVLYPDLPSSTFGQYRIECCWPLLRKADEAHKMWFVMIDSSVPKIPMRNYKHLFRISLWPKAHFAVHFDNSIAQGEGAPDLSRGAMDKFAEEGTNDRHGTRSLAQYWLKKCMQDADGRHGLCNRLGEEYLPTRLLDVRYALEEGKVRLVCPTEHPASFTSSRQYASLSHCWGSWGAKENPVLLGTNLVDRKTAGLPWSALPKTFQDAFKITSWLGLDWLWIDSLCIVQDSKADWQAEASFMDRVYMNAEVNISADSGEDSRAGCFAKREDIEVTPFEFAATQTQHSWVVTSQNLFGWMKSATSLSRAWIHRERQLARRILHFTEKELVWECCGHGNACFASESIPGGLGSDETLFNGGGQIPKQTRRCRHPNRSNRRCEGVCEETAASARLMELDLPRSFEQVGHMIPDDEYVCGLWRSTLPQSLTWWVPEDKFEGEDYIAPSWSWLCADSRVKLAARSSSHNYLPAAKILKFKSERETGDPYGRLTSAELHMSGYLRRLHFHFTEEGGLILSVVEEDENGQDRIRLIGPDWEKEEGSCFRITYDTRLLLPEQELECYAFFTSYQEWAQHLSSCERKFEALLLEKVDRSGGGESEPYHFRRIGSLDNISDEYGVKLRYKVAPDAQIPEAGVLRAAHVENPTGYSSRPGPARLTAGQTGQPEEEEGEKEEGEKEEGEKEEGEKEEGEKEEGEKEEGEKEEGEKEEGEKEEGEKEEGEKEEGEKEEGEKEEGEKEEGEKEEGEKEEGEKEEGEKEEGEKEEGEASNDIEKKKKPVDLWAMLAAYIRHKRWDVIKAAQDAEDRERKKEEADAKASQNADQNETSSEADASASTSDIGDATDVTTATEEDSGSDIGDATDTMAAVEEDSGSDSSETEEEDERDTRVLWYILQILKHPSSGISYSSTSGSEGESRKWLAEAWVIDSDTVAYGVEQEPAEVIYQLTTPLMSG